MRLWGRVLPLLLLAAGAVSWAEPAPAPPPQETQAAATEPAAPPPQTAPSPDSPAALPFPGEASPSLEAEISREISRAQSSLAEMEQAGSRMARAEAEEKSRAGSDLERATRLSLEIRSAPPRSPRADQLYEAVVDEMKEARTRLRAALDDLGAPPPLPRFTPALDPERLEAPRLSMRVQDLRRVYTEIDRVRSRLTRKWNASLWTAVEDRAARLQSLNEVRITCLARLSEAKQSRIFGLTREGVTQLKRETEQLALSARLFAVARLRYIRDLPARAHDIFTVGVAAYDLLKFLAILVVALFLKRRVQPIRRVARLLLLKWGRGLRWTRRVEGILGAAEVLAPWAYFLLVLLALRWALAEAGTWPTFSLLFGLVLLYGAYRLCLDALFSVIVKAARHYRLHLDEERTARIQRSLHTVLRVLLATVILLQFSQRLLGQGYLYHLVVNLAGIILLGALIRVLGSWRTTIADAYLKMGPAGRLANLVGQTRDRWYGVFLAAASFAWLAGRAALVLARDFALGFDQTRKALAFLFRRRMEKQAERQGYSPGDIDSLPGPLREAFSPEPLLDGPLVVDNFPGLDHFREAFEIWRSGDRGGSFLLAGDPGIGKTSWLGRIRPDSLPVTRVSLDRRVLTAGGLIEVLGAGLAVSGERMGSLEGLAGALRAGPKRLLILDGVESLFLSCVGGYEAFSALIRLMDATDSRIFWLCSLGSLAFQHLSAVRPDLAVFRARQVLPPWSEERIQELIRMRTSASKVSLSYEDLVVDQMEGLEFQARLLETEEGYIRLLWDYSDGNPGVALHFWLRSLVPQSPDRIRVRLFRAPSTEELENAGEPGLILLASVALHEHLTLEEAVSTTRYPEELCRIYLGRYLDLGILSQREKQYRLTIHWLRAAIRLLARRSLLAD